MTVNNALPGNHDTDRIRGLDARNAGLKGVSPEAHKAAPVAANPVGRDGTPEDFGAVRAFLCSQQAAFIVEQNVLVDGGEVNATF